MAYKDFPLIPELFLILFAQSSAFLSSPFFFCSFLFVFSCFWPIYVILLGFFFLWLLNWLLMDVTVCVCECVCGLSQIRCHLYGRMWAATRYAISLCCSVNMNAIFDGPAQSITIRPDAKQPTYAGGLTFKGRNYFVYLLTLWLYACQCVCFKNAWPLELLTASSDWRLIGGVSSSETAGGLLLCAVVKWSKV